jgi:hypothetical protein
MEEIIKLWLAKPWWEQLINISIIVGGLIIFGWSFIRFLKELRKNKTTKVKFNSEGVEIDSEALNKEDLSPTERKLWNLIENKDKDMVILKDQILELQKKVQDLEFALKIRTTEDEIKRKLLLPLSKHEVFTNMQSYIERGIDLSVFKGSEEKKIITKAFFERCEIPVFRERLKDFVTSIEETSEDNKLTTLYTLPELLYQWVDECEQKALSIKIDFNDGSCIYGIPKVFLDRFGKINRDHIQLTYDKIKSIMFSSFYRTWQIRTIVILELFDVMFSIKRDDVQKTMLSLNGELDSEINRLLGKCN